MLKVVFVCLGNICCLLMVEGLFWKEVVEVGLMNEIKIDFVVIGIWNLGKLLYCGM